MQASNKDLKNEVLRCAQDDTESRGPSESAAFFDVDGTIIKTTIVHYFVYYKLRTLPRGRAAFWLPWFMLKCVAYLVLDKFDRSLLNGLVYRNYAGLAVQPTESAAGDCLRKIAAGRWLMGARQAIDEHRCARRRIVLVTGSLDFLMKPLADLIGGADILAATLEERNGRFTGRLIGGPVIAEEKARRMRAYADDHGLRLHECHAYGDSSADLPMLEAVGFPHVVNPERNLKALAAKRNWPIHHWPVESTH